MLIVGPGTQELETIWPDWKTPSSSNVNEVPAAGVMLYEESSSQAECSIQFIW